MDIFRKILIILFFVALLVSNAQVGQTTQTEESKLPEDTTTRLMVSELRIQGNTLITTSKLLENIPEIYNKSNQQLSVAPSESLYDLRVIRELIAEPGQPHQVSLRTIQGLTQYILSVYQKNDYSGIYVYVSEGAIGDDKKLVEGILPINILEAHVAKVTGKFFDAQGREMECYPLRLAIQEWAPIKLGKVGSQRELEHFVNLMNLTPSRHFSALISRGAEPNTLAIQYEVREKPPILRKRKITPRSREQINIAKIIYDAYPHSDLLPINPKQDCRSLQSLQAKVTGENIEDGLFSFMVCEIVENGDSTLDGAIRVMERAKSNMETVLRALRNADKLE